MIPTDQSNKQYRKHNLSQAGPARAWFAALTEGIYFFPPDTYFHQIIIISHILTDMHWSLAQGHGRIHKWRLKLCVT